jgi:hypothetical protein
LNFFLLIEVSDKALNVLKAVPRAPLQHCVDILHHAEVGAHFRRQASHLAELRDQTHFSSSSLVFDYGQGLVIILNLDVVFLFEVLLEGDVFVVFAFESGIRGPGKVNRIYLVRVRLGAVSSRNRFKLEFLNHLFLSLVVGQHLI